MLKKWSAQICILFLYYIARSKEWRKNICLKPALPASHQKGILIKRTTRSKLYETKTRGIEIKHALNGGEQRINGHYVDGYHEESRTVFDSMDITGMDALLISQTETEFSIITV